jgi:ubiquinone/menaquinone biosynthesis C-methylase UbiE
MIKILERDKSEIFKAFLKKISSEIYSEPDTRMHMEIINKITPNFARHYIKDKSVKILDVGCGQGYACQKFKALGFENITAITLSDEDVKATKERGFECYKMDMSFLDFTDKTFDILWVRHALEHSPFPYLTLLEFNRVLQDGGNAYIEVPKPDTPRVLEHRRNHYSILGKKMWSSLFIRSGFGVQISSEIGTLLRHPKTKKPIEEKYLTFVIKKVRDEKIDTIS